MFLDNRLSTYAAIFAGSIGFGVMSAGAATVGAVSVSSPQGDLGGVNALENMINQSGLSANYVDGVDDFAAFTGATTHATLASDNSGFTGTETEGPQQFSFDLGSILTVSGVAIWNTTSVGAVNSIEILYDDDGDFTNGTLGALVGPSALNTSDLTAQVFGFAAVDTRYIHINGLASLSPPDFYGLAEVVFDGSPTGLTPVPVPGALPLLAAGLGGLVVFRRRRKT